MRYSLYGLFASGGFPVMEQLIREKENTPHENFIEIARRHFLNSNQQGRTFDGIMIVLEDSTAFVYSFK